MSDELVHMRSLLGASTTLWAGEARVSVQADHWSALSGAPSAEYNVVLCHGDTADGGLDAGLEAIGAAGVPAIAMVAGAALGRVQRLVELGWVCIGSVPFMRCELGGEIAAGLDSTVRRLAQGELGAVRRLVETVFGIGPQLAELAVPSGAADRAGQSVWGINGDAGELVACLASVRCEDVVAIWSMATAAETRRRGHGTALLRCALAAAAQDGCRASLLYASAQGEPFYRALGYRVLEHWQLWSRPRWVLGRA